MKMKNNNYIWSVKQNKTYYKICGIYSKLRNIQDINDFEKQLLDDVSKLQGMFELLKLESDIVDVKSFNEDSEILAIYFRNMVQEIDSRTGCLQNKKFSLLVLDYFLTLKPLLK